MNTEFFKNSESFKNFSPSIRDVGNVCGICNVCNNKMEELAKVETELIDGQENIVLFFCADCETVQRIFTFVPAAKDEAIEVFSGQIFQDEEARIVFKEFLNLLGEV